MNLTYSAGKKLYEKTVDSVLNYISKDGESNLSSLIDWTQRFMGGIFQDKYYDAARELLVAKDGKWMQYVKSAVDEIDPHVLWCSSVAVV